MERVPDGTQTQAVLDFMLFLNDTLQQRTRQFEDATLCSFEELSVLRVLAQRGPLMVKEIAQALPGMNLSKLTRVLDSLEKQGYITRTLNREDRRSFLVTATEQGMQLLETFLRKLEGLGQGMLKTLTSTERLVLVELFAKIQANWGEAASEDG
jgi:DNA-binding MarR family transcriptional regulator